MRPAPHRSQYGSSKYGPPKFDQARRIIDLFGGEQEIAKLLNVNLSTVYRWNYPPPKGANGIVPTRVMAQLLPLARLHGILITHEQLALTLTPQPKEKK